jgi:hypothetical protein
LTVVKYVLYHLPCIKAKSKQAGREVLAMRKHFIGILVIGVAVAVWLVAYKVTGLVFPV